MMSEQIVVKKLLESLRQSLSSKNRAKCLETITIIAEYFDGSVTSSQINYALELLLRWDDQKISILRFLAGSLPHSKTEKFNECNKKIFELIQTLVKLYPERIREYSKDIVSACTIYLQSSQVTAFEKECAAQTIKDLVFKEALSDEVDMSKLIADTMAILDQKNPPMRLQQHIYELLGMLSKKHPNHFERNKAVTLRNKMINTIQTLFKADKLISLTLISGAVDGLKSHLINFLPTPEEDPEFSEKLYECMVQLSNPDKLPSNASSNRVAFRNMLMTVHQYGSYHEIPRLLFRDYKMWHKVLLTWISSKLYDDKNAGIQATQTFHAQIANVLEQRRNDDDKRILLFFMKYFEDTLKSPQSQPHEIRIAIRGFGAMAVACKLLLEPKYLSERFDLVMQRIEYSYHTKDRLKRREVLEHLPNYVESLSQIMNQLEEVSGIQLQSLEAIVVILIKDFHYLSTAHQGLVAKSLLEAFSNLEKLGGKMLENVLESVIWQGILWTCSHQLVYDLQENLDSVKDWKEAITYKKYIPLWQRLLTPDDEKHLVISKIIYTYFIKDLFQIIDKLDLSTKKRKFYDESMNVDKEFFFSDPSLDLEPVRAENFHILYNLVQFYGDVISKQSDESLRDNFLEWLELWQEKSIQLSLKHPLVSGFLLLIEIWLKVMNRLDIGSDDDNDEARKIIEPLSFYIKSMLLARCPQMSGELQIVCLQVIFQTPTTILKEYITEITQIFVIGFIVGKSLLHVAQLALTCFERIVDSLSEHPKTRKKILEDVLPCLETFLSSPDSGEPELVKFKPGGRRIKMIAQTSIETDLMRFKKKILLFLGNFDPSEAQLVLSKFDQKLVKDHFTKVFQVELQCDEKKLPLIELDDIIGRVCQLALSSSERSTKISACELLHGLVLYMMGKNLDGLDTLSLWKELCNNMVILGADKDQTVRQLFEPLLMQMMHYFAQPSKILSPMATAMVESLMTMICYRENSGVQDMSARLLREFILWLNKGTDRNQRKASPVKLVDLFCEMKKMSIETDVSRRLGATLAFNNIYRIIREDEALIDVYWLYLLDVFGTNFKSSEDFSAEFDSNFIDGRRFEQVSFSMDHLTRVFVERSDIFHRSNSDRIRPAGFEGITLLDVLKWLFKESGSPEYHYRHKCMEMYVKILPECGTKEEIYEQNLSLEKILSVGEENGIAKHPDLSCLKECQEPIFKEVYKWMQTFLVSLDFYIWIFENKMIPQSEVKKFLHQSVILHSMAFFIQKVITKNMVDLVRSINETLINESLMSYEAKMCNRNLDNIDTIRCVIIVKIIDFLTILTNENIAQFFNDSQIELMKITSTLIFKSNRLSFDYKSKIELLELPHRLTVFVKSVNEHAPHDFRNSLMNKLQMKLIKYLNSLCQHYEKLIDQSFIDSIEINKVQGLDLMITNMKEFLSLDYLAQELLCKTADVLLNKVFNGVMEVKSEIRRPRHLTPSTKAFMSSTVRLCLKVDVFLPKIIEFSFNDTILKISESCFVRHGEHFLQVFKHPVYELFTSMLTNTIQILVTNMTEIEGTQMRIISILTELNVYIFKYHKDNQAILEENVTAMIAQWPIIIRIALEMENNLNCVDLSLINLVSHMAMTSPIEHVQLGQRLEKFQSWLLALLENKENSLELKSKAVFLLPLVTGSEDTSNEKLMKALNSIQQKHMPLRSHEFPENSLERAGLVAITEALFVALLRSRSPVIYRFLINITIADDNYILESKLQKVQADLMESLTSHEQEVIMNQTFDAFINGGFAPEIRLSFVSRFLLTIMKNCHVNVMMSFVRQKMNTIWNLTESSLDIDTENSFVNRCGGYMIFEAFIALVPKDRVEKESFNYAGRVNNGATMVKDFIKKTNDVRKAIIYVVDDPVRQELSRKFHCYSYRALAATVANHKDKPELYNLALFKDASRNGYIWQKMIDVRNENLYSNWTQDFQELPRLKEYVVSVRDLPSIKSTKPKYIETLSIFDQSLSQSLTKNDLSYSVVLSNREALEREQQRLELEHQSTMKVQLESTPINDHEIMSVLVGVIHHIHQNRISPFLDLDKADQSKYEWVLSLAASMKNRDNHKNVRIFLAKLVDNCRDVFVYYAKQMLGSILSVIVDGCLGDKMNFFITDLVAMVLSWSHVYKPTEMSEKQDTCALLKFLMENAHSDHDEVFKLNLELIKKMTETWSEILAEKIPSQTLLDLLQKPIEQENNQKLRCGIQLNAVVLANDLVPWVNEEQRNMFIKAVVGCFNNPSANVYQAAAQLLGMFLKKIIGEEEMQEGDENFEIVDQITQKLKKIQKKAGNDVNVFLQLLYGIQKNFPRILDPFMTLIKFTIPKAVRKIKCIYLEMFLSRLEVEGENVYREIVTIGIKSLLKQKEYQLLALHIINKALEYLKANEIDDLMNDLTFLSNSTRDEVRIILTEMMIFIAEKFRNDENFDRKKPMRIILKGFTDSDQMVQNRVANFFSVEGELPKTFLEKFQELLQNYYDPSVEKEFLHYTTQLLLDISIRHPRSQKPLLDYDPTKNKEFFEYPVTTKSSSQRSLPPMFIQSQQKQLLAGDGSIYDQLVRATQLSGDNQMFSPTQDPIKMTQVTQTFAFSQTQNSLFFSLKPQFLDKRSRTCSQSVTEELDIEEQIARNKEKMMPDAFDYLRKRIVRKDEQGRSKEYALKAIERRNFYEATREAKVKQSREGKDVVLYRRYRLGELPDFFFNSLAILMPLQALAKKDNSIARGIFISIFQSLVDILKESDEDAEKNFFVSINKSIMSIIQQTKNSDPFLLGTIIEMAMKSEKYLEISPNVLSNVAVMNNMNVAGVLFLESQIIHLMSETNENEDEEPNVKRQKTDRDNTTLNHWLKLIDLNYKMSEYEVVCGIFTEKLYLEPAIKDQLITAIDFESSGQYVDASKAYQQLIIKTHAHNASEKEFYYQSYFYCLEQLSDWREITKEVRLQFDNYDEVWNEDIPFHKETLLPHLIKSELRMILNENIDDEFLNIFEDWMNNEEKGNYLRTVFPEEVTMLHIVDLKFAEGSVEAEKALRNYGDEWSCLEMLDERMKCLKSSRTMAELNNFIDLMTTSLLAKNCPETGNSALKKLSRELFRKLYRNWKLSQPQPSDSLVEWGDLVAYRKCFFSLIPEEEQLDDGLSYVMDINQNLLKVAFAQKNCDAARFIINDLIDHIAAKPIEEDVFKCDLSIGKYNMMRVEQQLMQPDDQWIKLCKGLKVIVEDVVKRDVKKYPNIAVEAFCCASEITWKLWKIYEKCRADRVEIPANYQQTVADLIGAMDDEVELTDHLLKYSESSLKSARKCAQKALDEGGTAEKESQLASTYLKMGQFYHKVYGSGTVTSQEIQLKIIKSIFRAIAYGSDDAKLYIPYILQLSELKNNNLTTEFNEELNMVPEWMFISYISQMLSNYDFEQDCYLDKILFKLAVKYPNALYFPFKLARNHYKTKTENRGMEKEHVSKINDAISSPSMDKFMMAVQCLVLPEKMLDAHFHNLKYFIDETGAKMTDEKFREAVKQFNQDVFINNREMQGADFARVNKDFKRSFQNLEKMKWSTQKSAIEKEIRTLSKSISELSNRKAPISTLEVHRLCNWFAEYKWCGDKDFIEIPGQYTGDMKPFVEQHVKIVRFENRLKVFTSKQQPIEIKMYGSDGKSYSFINKYGEDLRQDQRIQQVLDLMSRQLAMDKNCKQNHLKIQTYQVVPINSTCGMLSVVQDTTTINEYLQEASKKFMKRTFLEFRDKARRKFRDFLLGNNLFIDWQKMYELGVMERSREQLIEMMSSLEVMFPKDMIRRFLMNSAISLETYFILRKNFITSMVAMNIAHWLLGIGDRHLSNILIDTKTGRLIGIDFGVAFGAGANLSIPETVPFRMTSHFMNVLEPLGIDGMIKKNMVHVLRCLRDHSQEILLCLEMFVKEPTMDWLMRAKLKSVGNVDSDVSLASSDWNPEARIAIVQRKLEGANPVKIIQDELRISQIAGKAELLERYMMLTEGGNDSLRKKMNSEGLYADEQVACLIEMATDKALLACIYIGWDPWI